MDTYSSSYALTTIWKFGWWYDWGHKGANGYNATRPATNGVVESYKSLGFRYHGNDDRWGSTSTKVYMLRGCSFQTKGAGIYGLYTCPYDWSSNTSFGFRYYGNDLSVDSASVNRISAASPHRYGSFVSGYRAAGVYTCYGWTTKDEVSGTRGFRYNMKRWILEYRYIYN